jgi:hypothetical protein
MQLVGLKSFRVAAVLLLGLLCYDVFWVFGSPSVIGENVMLTVATSGEQRFISAYMKEGRNRLRETNGG